MNWIQNNPVIVGTAIKALLALATIAGLQTTEADREAVVAAVIAVAAAWAVLTKKTRDSVTPMHKVEGHVESVVKGLGPETVGAVGNITNAGRAVVDRILFPGRVPHNSK